MKKAGKRKVASQAKKQSTKSAIRLRREEAKLNQGAIAEKLGLSISQYSRIEQNPESAPAWQIIKIAEIFGVAMQDLFEKSGALDGKPNIGLARLYRAVPVMDLSELGSRGAMIDDRERQYAVPTREMSMKAFCIVIKDDANNHLGQGWRLALGDKAFCEPVAEPEPGDPVVAELLRTGEIAIGAYQPLHASNPDAPGFTVKPRNPNFDEVRCTKKNPGKILGKIVERSERFS